MKVKLLFAAEDPPEAAALPVHHADLRRDLDLDTVVEAMAGGDDLIRDGCLRCVLADPISIPDVRYRQAILTDFLAHPELARALYQLACDAAEVKRRIRVGLFNRDHPTWILRSAVSILTELTTSLRGLREFSQTNRRTFASAGLQQLLTVIDTDLDDEYLAVLDDHLYRLKFPAGVHLTASFGPGALGTDYVLRRPVTVRNWWLAQWERVTRRDTYTYRLAPRDQAGADILNWLKDQGVNQVADAAAQSADHIIDFFAHLRQELAFYIGCINLHERLRETTVTCMPDPASPASATLAVHGLVDAGLRLRSSAAPVPNDLEATGKSLVMITGANQGGKSTFMRAVGLAQLMMQAGCFVTARAFSSSICSGVFTHFRREEDATLTHGKLDEELDRMSGLIDLISAQAMLLCNESFACTNEREGSQIALDIVNTLNEHQTRVIYVTHMYALANGLADQRGDTAVFLRAERLKDGRRTFQLRPGMPQTTSHGRDLYERVFGTGNELTTASPGLAL
ncbi:MAG: MutS-related protein [Propionibacteriaceae bacterium]